MSNKGNIFVERRPEGDYAVRKPNAERASDVLPTQGQAIERARELNPGHSPDVERVRHTQAWPQSANISKPASEIGWRGDFRPTILSRIKRDGGCHEFSYPRP